MIGALKFEELRNKAKPGDNVLEKVVDEWVVREQAVTSARTPAASSAPAHS